MDTLFWIQCNPKISIAHTTKKFFGRYLYKLVVYCPAGRLLDTKPNVAMVDALEHRRTMARSINHGGWWGIRYNKDLSNANIDFLTLLRDIKLNRTLNLKMRIEEPRIQIYAETEQQLKDLINIHFTAQQKHSVELMFGPEDHVAEAVLNSGAIIRKNDFGYKYKVILKDGRYNNQVKDSLYNYLTNLGPEEVKIPASGIQMLSKGTNYIWNLYFFANDLNVLTFLNLISPGIVSNTHELVVLEHK